MPKRCRCGSTVLPSLAAKNVPPYCQMCSGLIDLQSEQITDQYQKQAQMGLSAQTFPPLMGSPQSKGGPMLIAKPKKKSKTTSPAINLEKCWYVVEKGRFPHNCVSECDLCSKTVHPGQVVYIDRKKQVELQKPYFVMHKECMQSLVSAAPPSPTEVEYEQIRDRVQSGGPLF